MIIVTLHILDSSPQPPPLPFPIPVLFVVREISACAAGKRKCTHTLPLSFNSPSPKQIRHITPQSRQSVKLFLQSSELGLPPSPAGEYAPTRGSGGRGTLAGEREMGWEIPNSDEGTYTVVLFICTYFVLYPIPPPLSQHRQNYLPLHFTSPFLLVNVKTIGHLPDSLSTSTLL